jgi:hypothetical protein
MASHQTIEKTVKYLKEFSFFDINLFFKLKYKF